MPGNLDARHALDRVNRRELLVDDPGDLGLLRGEDRVDLVTEWRKNAIDDACYDQSDRHDDPCLPVDLAREVPDVEPRRVQASAADGFAALAAELDGFW